MLRRLIFSLVALIVLAAHPGFAFGADALTIDIFGPGQSRINMTLAEPLPSNPGNTVPQEARQFSKYVEQNLGFLPFLKLVPEESILGGSKIGGLTRDKIDLRRFQLSKVDLVMTMGWRKTEADFGSRVEYRVYEAFSGRTVTEGAYTRINVDTVVKAADMFCSKFMEALTGRGDFFRSKLAFTKKNGGAREIWTMSATGRGLRQLTFFGGSSVSPTWSPKGRYLAFAHHSSYSHTLGIWDEKSNRIFRSRLPGTTIGGTAFMPGGNIAVALSRGSNMEIFKMSKDLTRIDKTLVANWAIDVSPAFDAEGKKMAFTSDRAGNPQVFVKDLRTSKTRRVTFEGKYNTSPSLSPAGKLVTFSRRTKHGHRIFVHDLATGRERQITFGPGSDEEPAFSPDGYFIVFASNRSGAYRLYLTTRHGDKPRLLKTGKGAVTHPVFGLRTDM